MSWASLNFKYTAMKNLKICIKHEEVIMMERRSRLINRKYSSDDPVKSPQTHRHVKNHRTHEKAVSSGESVFNHSHKDNSLYFNWSDDDAGDEECLKRRDEAHQQG